MVLLKEYPKTAVNVVATTDSTGSYDRHASVAAARADSAASSLITRGVVTDASRIRTSARMGPANPHAKSNSTAEGKAQTAASKLPFESIAVKRDSTGKAAFLPGLEYPFSRPDTRRIIR